MFNEDSSRIFLKCTVRDWSGNVDCAFLSHAALVDLGVDSEASFRQRATDFQPLSNTWNVRGAFSIAQSLGVSSMSKLHEHFEYSSKVVMAGCLGCWCLFPVGVLCNAEC